MIRNFARRVMRRIAALIYDPKLEVEPHPFRLERLGTAYGGWVFAHDPGLEGATILSCGLGEDASFDVEFARRYQARVVIVDPTPRAIEHFRRIAERYGLPAARPYTTDGALPPDSYDLRGIDARSLSLIDKALWNETGTLRFYAPPNPSYVSHSLVNFQNDYREDTRYIEVESSTIDAILAVAEVASVPLIKLDIEGAEIEVIADMMSRRVLPDQILVEYDEINVPSPKSRARVRSAHALLRSHGYALIHFEWPSNATYRRVRGAGAG